MGDSKYLIIPNCSDLNRGDQALVWETVRLAKDAGFEGDYYMISHSEGEDVKQTLAEGIKIFKPILLHPSRFSKNKNNVTYNTLLKLKWGLIAFLDLIFSILLLLKPIRPVLKMLSNERIKRTLLLFEQSDVCFVKGGGFIHAYGGITATYQMYYSLYHIALALSMGKKVYIMPNSYGPFKGFLVKNICKSILSKCDFISTRESISKEMVNNELNLDINLYPDLAFYLQMDDREKAREILLANNVPIESNKCVAITMRPYRFPNSDNPKEKYKAYKQSLKVFVEWLSDKGYFPVLMVHTRALNHHEDDEACINDVVSMLREDINYYIISDESLNCRQLKSIYSHFNFIIGTRFHSVIFSITENIPAVAITYGGNKGDGIMKDMNLSEYTLPIDSLNSEMLITKFESLNKNKEEVKEKLDLYCKKTQISRKQLIEEIKKINLK